MEMRYLMRNGYKAELNFWHLLYVVCMCWVQNKLKAEFDIERRGRMWHEIKVGHDLSRACHYARNDMSCYFEMMSSVVHFVMGRLDLVICEASQYKVECRMFGSQVTSKLREPWAALDMKIWNVVCEMMSSATFFLYGDWIALRLVTLNQGHTRH